MSQPPRDASVPVLVARRQDGSSTWERDALVREEPLEVRLRTAGSEATRWVVTMRTPGDDADLVHGLLFGEGVIASASEVTALTAPDDPRLAPELAANVLVATLRSEPPAARRATVMGSACGVCGRTSIEDVLALAKKSREGRPAIEARLAIGVLVSLPGRLREHQSLFATTGGLHAAGAFELDGTLVAAREDVGRHNATDKVIGALLRAGRAVPPVLLVSGRIGFEIAQKAALAGFAIVAAVSAPTSLAVDLAEQAGLTLVGFLRGSRFNVYTHPERIAAS